MLILLGDAIDRVDHQQRDIRPFDGAHGAQHAELLHPRVDLAGAADAGRIDQRDGHALPENLRVDGVARGTGDRADNDALFAQQSV